jgi:DNA processing protein
MHSHTDLLQLLQVPAMGPARCRAAVDHFGTPASVRAAAPEELSCVPGWGPSFALAAWKYFREEGERSARFAAEQCRLAALRGAAIISLWDRTYPALLSTIYDPPVLLYVQGMVREDDRLSLAVVGSRSPSAYGRTRAAALSAEAVRAGLTVVSGLARGIDTAAHEAALRHGGRTIAVLGSGLDRVYPPENLELSRRIACQGAVVSEFPMGTGPERSNFPRRNRIVSGLALGTVLVESTLTGGGMITARLALEQNREVFALPGPVDAPMSRGSNALIRDGRAKLVESLADILPEIVPPLGARPPLAP